MRRTSTIFATFIASFLLVSGVPAAGEGPPPGIAITDPEVLVAIGLEPDATNVFATPQALDQFWLSLAGDAPTPELGGGPELGLRGGPYGVGPENVGATVLSYASFVPVQSSETFVPGYVRAPGSGLYCTGGTHSFAAHMESLPHGGFLANAQVYVSDTSTDEDMSVFLYETCQFNTEDPLVTLLGMASSSGSGGNQRLAIPGLDRTINSQACEYTVRARLDAGGFLIFECSEQANLVLYKARALWYRQVTPAPAVATFGDVPTGHPFFQYVEALVDSGITAGCGGGNYCPNDPLTRGQMAVFLASALGLHYDSGLGLP